MTTGIATQYDAVGRVSSISYSDGTPTKNFLYDVSAGWGETQSNLKGRLSKALVPALGNEEGDIFSYDQMGRIVFTGQCFAYGCGNGADDKYINDVYDWVGNLTSQYDPTAGVIDYTYNPANQLLSATNQTYTDTTNPPDLISNMQNGPNGPISYQQGNGLGDFRTYDGLGRNDGKWVCQGTSPSYHCETGSEPQIYGTELNWSGLQVKADCDTVMGTCRIFGYDEFGRLNASAVPGGAESFTYVYDRYGNRWQQNVTAGSGPSPSVTFNKSTNQIIGDSYDAAGNLTSDGIHTYTYDPEGNVTAVDGGSTASYTYDALNRRVRVANASGTDDYTFDAIGRRVTEWQESTNSGIEASEYWGASSERIAYRNGPTVFEQQDWLGTERVRTTASGAVQTDYASLPFGDGFSGVGTDADPAHFAGLDHDAESSTDHAQYRQYSEAMGRWMSPDPYDGSYDWSNPQSFNRYAYVLGNPLGMADPSGRAGEVPLYELYAYSTPLDTGLDVSAFFDLGLSIAAEVGLDYLFEDLFAPQFHGTLQPRPSAPNNDLTPKDPCQYQGDALSPSSYADAGKATNIWRHPLSFFAYAADFGKNLALDAQPLAMEGGANVIQAAAYGNYVFGVYMAAAGLPLSTTLEAANVHAYQASAHYGPIMGPLDSAYPSIPEANVNNITNGYKAEQSGTPCTQ